MIKKSHSYEPFPRIHFIWPIQTVFETSRAARSLLVSKQTSIFSTHTKFQPVLPAPVPLNLFIPLATIFLIDKTAVVVAIARDVPCFVSSHHTLIPGTGLTTMRTTMRTTTTTMNGSPQKLSRIKICWSILFTLPCRQLGAPVANYGEKKKIKIKDFQQWEWNSTFPTWCCTVGSLRKCPRFCGHAFFNNLKWLELTALMTDKRQEPSLIGYVPERY